MSALTRVDLSDGSRNDWGLPETHNGSASTVPLGGIASGIRFEVVGHGEKSCVCVCVKKTV